MDLALYAVNAVLVEGRSTREVARAINRSKSFVHRHVALYRAGGEAALAPRRRGPDRARNQTPLDVEDLVVGLRKELVDFGVDAGARTIHYHLTQRRLPAPSLTTIHRILVRRGFVTPEPAKRPRTVWTRFESTLPNECWQTDMTHWSLEDSTRVEVVNLIDDYSRLVLASVAVEVATAASVLELFWRTARAYGLPSALLSDNAQIFTGAYRSSATALEVELAALSIDFRHGRPYHPQTQGKIERYHRTLKKWLVRQPRATSLATLQAQLDVFSAYYNEVRPHQARSTTPQRAYRSLDRAVPIVAGRPVTPTTRVRRDRVGANGTVTLRFNGVLYTLSLGRRFARERVIMLVADLDVRVLDLEGRVLRQLTLDPTRKFQARR